MWRTWTAGQQVTYTVNDFDGHGEFIGTVTEVHQDHAIVKVDDMTLWVEDFNQNMFR